VLAESCSASYIASTTRLVAAVGLRDCVVVETRDAVLVMAKEEAQSIQRLVDQVSARAKGAS
jgi:hypothetical protein